MRGFRLLTVTIPVRKLILLSFVLLPFNGAFAQLGFFESYWEPKSIESPEYIGQFLSPQTPEMVISIDMADTIRKISPYVGGYNLNTYYGGKIYNKPELLKRIQDLELSFTRFPGGSGSNWYFWDRAKPDLPGDVDYMTIKEEVVHISSQIKWGDIPGDDYLSLDNSYVLRDSCNNEAIHVVNYSYARYGRAEDPVAQAAHYAADWVRYDNGRTKFWEIGNEIYGSWEPGYIIDTSRNKDGQPMKITGELYAQHCLVFLDSMRAAAAETGVEIRIGATLGFQESRSEWDEPVIRILKDKVDFYIVHKYFGSGQDASPVEVFQSIDEFYQHKLHIDAMINSYCESYVPLVITEWNTRYEGSNQNVSCANGMHTMLGMKAIVNEGLGLSCKWNLIWGYKDGNTHGLISGEKDNPSIEGIPAFYPRAPYFYHYFFKKMLGDVSVRPDASKTEGVDVFASSFASGHAGAILVNTSGVPKNLVVNLENYQYGDRFYWYLLAPQDGQAFSRKVLVNGQTNSSYAAGGPDNYEDIQPWGAGLSGGLRIELPPYGTAFVLAEGSKQREEKDHLSSFTVFGMREGETAPLENAAVKIGSRMYLTDATGKVSVGVSGGIMRYELQANGYEPVTGSVDVSSDTTIADTLSYKRYNLDLALLETESGQPIEACEVRIAGQKGISGSDGRISFSGINYGNYLVEFRNKVYNEDIEISIYSDTSLTISLDSALHEINFQVFDKISNDPVNTAMVDWNGTILYTNLQGSVAASGKYGVYGFSVSKSDYLTTDATIELVSDTIISIYLSPEYADIKFRIYNGAMPVNGLKVDLDGNEKTTNSLGICTFTNLTTERTYSYSITRNGYNSIEGELLLLTDTTINIDYQDIKNEVVIQLTDGRKGFVLPASQVLLDGEFRQTDSDGKALYQIPSGSYELSASSDRYRDTTVQIDITRDTLYQLPLALQYAILRFQVVFEQEAISDATVTIGQQAETTNSLGMAVFNDMPVDSSYWYMVEKQGVGTYNNTVFVYHDTTLTVDLSETFADLYTQSTTKVFPIPVAEVLHIDSERELGEIILSDYSGRIVHYEAGPQAFEYQIETAGLTKGLYLLRIKFSQDGQVEYFRVPVVN